MAQAVREAGAASRWLWRSAGLTVVTYVFAAVLVFTAVSTLVVFGAVALPETVLLLRRLAGVKRRWVGEWTGTPVPEAYAPVTGGLAERFGAAVRDEGTRRDLRWLLAHYLYGFLLATATPVLWVLGLIVDACWSRVPGRAPVVLPLLGRLVDLDARWSRALLEPSPKAGERARLAERVAELTVTRAGAVAAHGAELRRIERDLHDGAQAHLVALSMRIGLARRARDSDPELARRLLAEAQDQAEAALAELRHVVRGIHPPVLADRGLSGAVRALAAASPLTVEVRDGAAPGAEAAGARAPAGVEAAAYFVVAEALTNAARHGGGRRAWVELRRSHRALSVSVRDDGRGGADESGGSGLLGVRRRVAALDGTVRLTSPPGGPTVIEVELPCAW
ncbi:histidine kinase [Streptomyces sp. NPDC049906]|uniref:sensor histidine kinase n=1 Tax=Streptomyces sp. NPDC049906 TaxID=3155656 RepID=UPI0034255D3A